MKVNIEHMVIGFSCSFISIFICFFMISQGIIWGAGAAEEPDPNGLYGTRGTGEIEELTGPTYEELVEKVNAHERRIVRLEFIIDMFKSLGEVLNDPLFETEIEAEIDEIVDAEPRKTNIVGTGILIGALILLVVGIAVLTIKLSRR